MDVEDDLDFRAPSLDFEILLKCQTKLGSSIGKGVNDVEKVLYKDHQSMLPVFTLLAFLESLELKRNPGKAVKHAFELAGRAFYVVSDFNRKNVLSIMGDNCMQLIENRDVFDVLEHKNLFGALIIDKLLKFGRLLEALVSLDVWARKRSGEREEIRVTWLTCTNISSSRVVGTGLEATKGVPTLRTLVLEAERLVLLTEPGRLISK
ncbi:hypothetical protein DAPPUDRAFT_246138 [Daphnia pulex]|uniref:Uncharacterized protein n=1 Tax=Daphnia pulex TaxID=6669 RepID=E9GPQ3_DAPPU|nr:hypothetical protein DAPPUDRAFT_246138 [Daphnia pulex]|eukprot:EFX78426.1 hypothetical protein DAPPUDRAFT_246138 [Daphnia pulex]